MVTFLFIITIIIIIIGGATKEETDSGLFIYSKKPIFEIIENKVINDDCDNCEMLYLDNNNKYKYKKINEIRRNPRVISQIDLAPTISLLLNIPLPFSSIGMLLPELLYNDNYLNSADSFLINALQVKCNIIYFLLIIIY